MKDIVTENYANTINKVATGAMTEEFAQNKQSKHWLLKKCTKNLQEQDKLISFAYIGTSDGKMLGFQSSILAKGMIHRNKAGLNKQPKSLIRSFGQIHMLMKQRKNDCLSHEGDCQNGKVIGVAGLDLKLSSIQTYINEQEIPYKGTAFLVDAQAPFWRIQQSKEKHIKGRFCEKSA